MPEVVKNPSQRMTPISKRQLLEMAEAEGRHPMYELEIIVNKIYKEWKNEHAS